MPVVSGQCAWPSTARFLHQLQACLEPVPTGPPMCLNKRPRFSATPVVSPLQLPVLGAGRARGQGAYPRSPCGLALVSALLPLAVQRDWALCTGICMSSPLASDIAHLPPAAAWVRSFWNIREYSGLAFEFYLINRAF